MIEEGLVAEVKALKARGYDRSMVSMQGLGYKRNSGLSGWSMHIRRCHLQNQTRHKDILQNVRFTWFKREKHVTWINKKELQFCKNQNALSELSSGKYKLSFAKKLDEALQLLNVYAFEYITEASNYNLDLKETLESILAAHGKELKKRFASWIYR